METERDNDGRRPLKRIVMPQLERLIVVGDELAGLVEPQSGLARQWREAKDGLAEVMPE